MIIDEDLFARRAFERALAQRGYAVVHAACWEDAEDATDLRAADLVVVDSTTDLGHALESARVLREDHGVKVARLESVLSSSPCTHAPVDLVIKRPISPEELALRVDLLMSGEDVELDSEAFDELNVSKPDLAREVEETLLRLETLVSSNADNESMNAAITTALEIERLCRRGGLLRVSHATGRIAQVLRRIDRRRGGLNRQLWLEVNDALDDAFVSNRRHLMEHRGELLERRPGSRHQALVVLYSKNEEMITVARDFCQRHLIGFESTPDFAGLQGLLNRRDFDGIFVDVDPEHNDGPDLLRRLRDRGLLDRPLAVIGPGGRSRLRFEAARVNAIRFLAKPFEPTDFGEAVHVMATLRRFDLARIAVIDHDQPRANKLTDSLSSDRFEVQHIESAPSALDLIGAFSPHAILISDNLPRVSGLELTRTLRAIPRWADVPILLYTARDDVSSRIEAFDAGVDDVMLEPLEPEDVEARLRARTRRLKILQDRADRDSLTRLLTRRAFLERLTVRMSEARRNKMPIAIVLLDLDNFKEVNDTYGHIAGDRVLSSLGRLLRQTFRVEDLRCRWGGEEFALALVDEATAHAKLALERLLDAFRVLEFEGDNGSTFSCTFSAGISEFDADAESFENLLKLADQRLFEAKRLGRARVVAGAQTSKHLEA